MFTTNEDLTHFWYEIFDKLFRNFVFYISTIVMKIFGVFNLICVQRPR